MLDMLFAATAWAQETGGGDAAGGGFGGLGSLLQGPLPMLILMFVIFYFLLIRPQQKRAKAQKEMLGSLKKGDAVVTAGGLYGRITGLTDTVVVLEVAPQVRVKVTRASVAGLAAGEAPVAKDAEAKNDKKK